MKKAGIIWLVLFLLLAYAVSGAESAAAPSAGDESYSLHRIDGSPDWDSVAVITADRVLWTEDAGIRAGGQLCYEDETLYVHLWATEKDIRAVNTEPLSPVHEDSCLEFFFQLPGYDSYFNFEINPIGCLRIQYGPTKEDRIDIVRNDAAAYFGIQADLTSDGWEVYYQIPLGFIRLFCPDARLAGEWRGNIYKCGNKTVKKHYLSWTRIDLETPNFHCPEYFGTFLFE